MKPFKSIREGNSVEPGVSEINDVPEDPMSFVEIKPKKSKVVKEASELGDLAHETTMKHRFLVTYSDPNHTMASMRKEKQQKHVLVPSTHKGETVYQGEAEPLVKKHMKKQGYKVHNVEHVGMVSKKVYEDLKDPSIFEGYSEEDIAKGGTVIYKHDGKHYMSKVSHTTGGGAATKIHTTSKLGHVIGLHHVVSTDASDWNRFKDRVVNEDWVQTGKTATHTTGEKTFEWAKVDDKGNRTGERHYRNASGKVMGESTELDEAVTVDKKNYSWGKMMTVHHGSDTSYPLHPEHQNAIKKLRPGMKTTFKDETGRMIHAHREGDSVHLVHHNTGSSTATKTTVGYHHFDEGYVPDHSGQLNKSDANTMGRLAALMAKEKTAAPKKPAGEYERKVTKYLKKKYNEGVDFDSVWNSIKPEEPVIEEDTSYDPVAGKKELDKIMQEAIDARKAGLFEVSQQLAHNYMVAAHKHYGSIEHKTDAASMAKKAKLEKGIKKAAEIRSPKPKPSPEHKIDMSSPAAYYASKKPGEYTGD